MIDLWLWLPSVCAIAGILLGHYLSQYRQYYEDWFLYRSQLIAVRHQLSIGISMENKAFLIFQVEAINTFCSSRHASKLSEGDIKKMFDIKAMITAARRVAEKENDQGNELSLAQGEFSTLYRSIYGDDCLEGEAGSNKSFNPEKAYKRIREEVKQLVERIDILLRDMGRFPSFLGWFTGKYAMSTLK